MKKYLFILFAISGLNTARSQSPGDTITVESFNYTQTYGTNQWSPGIRDTMIGFPDLPGVTFEKILMRYNLRCKDGNVSPGISGQTNIGCGEWDVSCNTYITDSSVVDSTINTESSHTITNFSGTNYEYTTAPTYNYYLNLQPGVTVDNIITETQSIIGIGVGTVNNVFSPNTKNGKSLFHYSQTDLVTAGVVSGNLDGLILNVTNTGGNVENLRIRIKQTSSSNLDAALPETGGYSEVYHHNTNLINGVNRLQFYTPFSWDGSSNLIVEYSFSATAAIATINFAGDISTNTALAATEDPIHLFNSYNHIEANNYMGISGNNPRTMEAWINTSIPNKEIITWGVNLTGEKWVFRLNGDGTPRIEVNGGYAYGSTPLDDGQWHHIACVFSGGDINSTVFYVDGVLETIGANLSETVNTETTTFKLKVGLGKNNQPFKGYIDEVRIWNSALSSSTLLEWMYQSVTPSHPNYNGLVVYYPLNEGVGSSLLDQSAFGNDATIIGGEIWNNLTGIDLFKGFTSSNAYPQTIFLQGDYNLTIENDSILDSVQLDPNYVTENQIISNEGTLLSDIVDPVSTQTYWQAGGYQYTYNENNMVIDSSYIVPDGIITTTTLNYYNRFPTKFEIMSFVTPYGINLDLGNGGKTWTFDLTDFSTVLKGNKRMTVERGGQWMEDMHIQFHFIVGTPPRDVLDISQIWKVDSKTYTSIAADNSYEPRTFNLLPNGVQFKIRSAITGHGQEGEFIPRTHYINIDGGNNEFEWTVWKECDQNPVYPQGGTWIYDRAGWCPGMPTMVTENDATPYVTPGQSAIIDYGITTATGTSNYIVNNQLVTYGPPNFSVDAAIVGITSPTNQVEYARTNSICNNPSIIIQNTGSTQMTSLTIEYWVKGSTVHDTFEWAGNLEFMEKTEVILPTTTTLWYPVTGSNDQFNVQVSSPNGLSDEYTFNNTYVSNFDFVDVVPQNFVVRFKTNSAASESKLHIYDNAGIPVFSKTNLSNNTTSSDTLNLTPGCYQMVLSDTDDDGIDFWANNDGNGSLQFRPIGGGATIQSFEGGFGDSLIFNFSVGYSLQLEELNKTNFKVYPNPASDYLVIENVNIDKATITIFNAIGQKVELPVNNEFHQRVIGLEGLNKGVYSVHIQLNNIVTTKTFIVH